MNQKSNSNGNGSSDVLATPEELEAMIAARVAMGVRLAEVIAEARAGLNTAKSAQLRPIYDREQKSFVKQMEITPEQMRAQNILALIRVRNLAVETGNTRDLPNIIKQLNQLCGVDVARTAAARPLAHLSEEELALLEQTARTADGAEIIN